MACELDLDLRLFDIEHAFEQTDLEQMCLYVCLCVAGSFRGW